MRPGRLDRILYVGPPDLSGREEILQIRMKSMTVETGIDVRVIAELVRHHPLVWTVVMNWPFQQTEGCSGAEITALCQEAAILTMQGDMNAPCVRFSLLKQQVLFLKQTRNRFRKMRLLWLRKLWSDKSHLQCCRNFRIGPMESKLERHKWSA